jgi:transmembrane sensor
MDEQHFFELAARYVSGLASDDEIELLHLLLKDQRFADLFRKVNDVWLDAGKTGKAAEFNTERGLDRLAGKLRKHEPVFRWGPNRRRFARTMYNRSAYYVMAGAVVFILLLFGIRMFEMDISTQSAARAWIEKSTRKGEKIILSLPDGSTITLNADSKIKYPAQFTLPSRDVFLEGEAYFSVAHDSARQFIVHTGRVSTTDLGTKFNISAFPSDSTIAVSLEEGTVAVASGNVDKAHRALVLAPSEQFIFNRRSGSSTVGSFDPRKTSGWRNNLFVFDNEPLSTVLVKMEREYGVKFEVSDTALTRRFIKADFHNESAWTVAEILKKATGLSCRAVTEENTLKKFIFTKN